MRILLTTITLGKFNETDGVANTYNNLIPFFKNNNIELDVVTYGPQDNIKQDGTVKIITHKPRIPIRIDPAPYYIDAGFLFSSTYRMLKNKKYDLVHSATPEMLGLGTMRIAKTQKIPLVCAYHTNLAKFAKERCEKIFGKKIGRGAYKLMNNYCAWYFNKADIFLAPTKGLQKEFGQYYSCKIGLMSRGVDLNKFNPKFRTKNNGKIRALYVGRVTPEKNLELLVDIFSKRDDVELTIVGDGYYLREMKEKLPKARYTGKLTGNKLLEEYANGDIFVFPSKSDTFGQVVLEAHASGLPVIVTSIGGPKEQIISGYDGFVASSDDEFSQVLSSLIANEQLRKKMGENARISVQKYSWKDVFDNLLSEYENILNIKRNE